MPPKSILKKTGLPAERNGKPVNQRHLDVALHHANVLEQRKAVEAQVLAAIITLMEYPPSPHADPARPTPAAAHAFAHAVAAFQPADYDALIEERNIAAKCGYALCPRPKRRARSTARKQFVDTDRGVEIVDRSVLEVWCSDDCARRALYIKVQLNEEPAWLRTGGYAERLELLVDNAPELRTEDAEPPARAEGHDEGHDEGDDEEDLHAAWAAHDTALDTHLARERGEKPGAVPPSTTLVHPTITEHASSRAPPQPPSLPAASTMAIEGHIPRHDRQKGKDGDEDEDENEQDWDRDLNG